MADPVVQEIKDRLDIVEVIGSYLQLKRAGVNWRANCPFHNEKTPSFNVNPARQIWHCFGCGEGGDLFTFVQRHEHLEFPEALKLLADRAGVALPERSPGFRAHDAKQKELRERLFRINSFAAEYYHRLLLSDKGAGAKTYLRGRGLADSTIAGWQIGYAPDEYQLLEGVLLAKGASRDDMVLAGVSARSARGTYDRFHGRITFPIFDFSGKIAGFSARVLQGEETAKYINSSESPIYNKSQLLFGLYQAKAAIRQQDYVVVVEGQMDCIKAHQAGFANTVATSGTALTLEQLRLLARLTKNVTLCFDTDAAGVRAAKKAGTLALQLGFAVKLITVEGAKDPDELISQSPKLWAAALQSSEWFIASFLGRAERQYPARSVEQRKFVAQEVVPLLRLLSDPLERDHYVLELTERFGYSSAAVTEMLAKPDISSTHALELGAGEAAPPQAPDKSEEVVPPGEKGVLGALLLKPALRNEWLSMGGASRSFSSAVAAELAAKIVSGDAAVVAQEPLAQEALFMVESQSQSFDGNEAAFLLELRKTIYTFRLTGLKSELQQVTANIRMAEGNTNISALRGFQHQFAELTRARLDLERKIQSL